MKFANSLVKLLADNPEAILSLQYEEGPSFTGLHLAIEAPAGRLRLHVCRRIPLVDCTDAVDFDSVITLQVRHMFDKLNQLYKEG